MTYELLQSAQEIDLIDLTCCDYDYYESGLDLLNEAQQDSLSPRQHEAKLPNFSLELV